MAKEDDLSNKERKEVKKMLIAEKIKNHSSVLKLEFKKQVSTAIIAAFGLIIALSWKDVINEAVSKIEFIQNYGLTITAVILTAISVIGILLMSKWAKSGENN
jgi:hypothetical protein